MIEKKKNMNQNAYYSRLFIEKEIATWREHKILQSSYVFLQYIRKFRFVYFDKKVNFCF